MFNYLIITKRQGLQDGELNTREGRSFLSRQVGKGAGNIKGPKSKQKVWKYQTEKSKLAMRESNTETENTSEWENNQTQVKLIRPGPTIKTGGKPHKGRTWSYNQVDSAYASAYSLRYILNGN